MRRAISLFTVPFLSFMIVGCSSAPSGDPAAQTTTVATDAELAAVTAQAQALQQALANHEGDIRAKPVVVQWVEPVATTPTPVQQRYGDALIQTASSTTTPPREPVEQAVHVEPTPQATQVRPVAQAPLAGRDQLVAALMRDFRTSDDPAMARALRAALASVIDPQVQLTSADLTGLSADQRDAVQRFRLLLIRLAGELVQGDAKLDHDMVLRQMDAVIARQPIWIREMKLCTSVSSFGVYETFASPRFIAGRAQPMVVYVELDHFQPEQQADGQYVVHLRRELELYTEADGLVVWREPAQEVIDESRNRRHDFFLAQLIELPANINVGKYLLKMRIVDMADGTRDERTVAIEYVADATLVNRIKRPTP